MPAGRAARLRQAGRRRPRRAAACWSAPAPGGRRPCSPAAPTSTRDAASRAVVHGVRTAAAAGAPRDRADQRLRRAEPGVGARARPVLISDHINLTGATPLEGATLRRPDRRLLRRGCATWPARSTRPCDEGVYVQFRGPQYETPAEVRMAKVHRRRPGRHVDDAGDHRRPRGRPGGARASRWSPTPPPASRPPRSTTPRCSQAGTARRAAPARPARRPARTAAELTAMLDADPARRSSTPGATSDPDPATAAALDDLLARGRRRRRRRRGRARRRLRRPARRSAPPGCAARSAPARTG